MSTRLVDNGQYLDMIETLELLYVTLADIRHQWPGRDTLAGQAILCRGRDAIAAATGRDPQEISSGNSSNVIRAALGAA